MAGSSVEQPVADMNCLLTGGNGFLCRHLVEYLTSYHLSVSTSTRKAVEELPKGVAANFVVGAIDGETQWQEAVKGQEVVVHLANRAHHPKEGREADLDRYRTVNVTGTVNLAQQCIAAKVKRFIYMSSIQVNGNRTIHKPFRCDDPVNPESPYAISKMEAEQSLCHLCETTGMELVIIRAPLVYGRGVKGNLKRLASVIDKGWPLPIAAIDNQRDMISAENLASLIWTCMKHPDAAGQTFLCSDKRSASTPELARLIARARGRQPRIFKMPMALLLVAGFISGKSSDIRRLSDNLLIDITHTLETLGWNPDISFEEGLSEAFSVGMTSQKSDG